MNLLPHVSFAILFALSNKSSHGYELIQTIAKDSNNSILLGAGALYSAIKRLSDDNLIELLPNDNDKDRRKAYRLTKKGWDTLEKDISYYKRVALLSDERPLNFN